VTGAAKSMIARRYPANYQMSGSEEIIQTDLPGRLASRFSDNNQLSLYMHWAKLMQANSWKEITGAAELA
jgi:hypothetical protein